MKQSLQTIGAVVRNYSALLVLFVLLASVAHAQITASTETLSKPSVAVTSAPKGIAGTLSHDKQTYTTKSGKILTVGQIITLGNPANTNGGLFINCVKSILHVPEVDSPLSGEGHAGQQYKIKEFYSQNGVTYLFFKPGPMIGSYMMAIEYAITTHELIVE